MYFSGPKKYSIEDATGLFFKNNMTEEQYHSVHMSAIGQNADIYPPLYRIQEQKKAMMPDGLEHPKSGEYLIPKQNVLNHRLSTMFEDQELLGKLRAFARDPNNRFLFIFKEGADGASGNSQYSNSEVDQSTIFASYMVPLMLKVENVVSKKANYLYVNRMANSWTAIIYLRLCFEKETKRKFLYPSFNIFFARKLFF